MKNGVVDHTHHITHQNQRETGLESAVIYEVSNSFDIDLTEIKAERKKEKEDAKEEEQRIKDYAEFQRLSKQFKDKK